MIRDRIFWAAVLDGNRNGDPLCYSKRTVLFLLLLIAIDNTNLNFMFLRKGPVGKINVQYTKVYLQFQKISVSWS